MSNDERNEKPGLTSPVSIAESECHQAGTGTRNIVPSHAARQPIGNEKQPDKWHKPNPAVLDFPTDNATHTITCEWCGRPIVAKRRWKRFCDGTCRQAAFKAARIGK